MKNDLTLYTLADDIQTLHDAIIEQEGEITVDIEKALDGLNMMLTDKIHNISRWALSLSATTKAIDDEIERLRKRRDARKNLQDRLKSYMMLAMQKSDKSKIEYDNMTVRIQRNPPSVEILNEQALPAKYVKIVQVMQIDRKGIIEALKSGEEIPGAELKAGTHLRIV